MCAVIGSRLINPTKKDFDMLYRLFLESSIRGLHATGVSYIKENTIYTEKYSIPASRFPFDFAKYVNEDGNLYLIGHCRYSTSDLIFNQPISNDNFSVVHNGVISQELPEHWKELYGYDCVTKNDTELLLHTLEENKSPLEIWKEASLSVCELHKDKTMRIYRNGKRPIYLTNLETGYIISSTKDIIKRANIIGITKRVEMDSYVTLSGIKESYESVATQSKDLQL